MDDSTDVFVHLREKMTKEIDEGHPYEALQLAESFVARKKKVLGRNTTSALVFQACNTLLEKHASSDAGSLLCWFIEDGAGDDYYFKLGDDYDATLSGTYCDLQRLQLILNNLDPVESYPFVEKIYGPIHKISLKKQIPPSSALRERLNVFEVTCIGIFEASKNYNSAYKAVIRMGDTARAAAILDAWSSLGYANEKPLFFCRAVLQQLADGDTEKADALVDNSRRFIIDDGVSCGGVESAPLATWHFAVILTKLARMEPRPRVDKAKVFGILADKYSPLLGRLDPKLILFLDKIGQNSFAIRPPQSDQPNPMAAMLQMLGGGGGGTSNAGKKGKGSKAQPTGPGGMPGGFDMNAMMSMLANMPK